MERSSILVSVVATTIFGTLGVVIALASQSAAVFLDGIFSLIFALAGVLTLYVSSLVTRPRDEQYPSGYAAYEPMLNLFKGLLITIALVYAVWGAMQALFRGGQEIIAEGGILYAVIATGGGAAVIYVLVRFNRAAKSPIVQVDIRNWTVDTLISAAVGVTFVATLILQNSGLSEWAPYADPIITLLIAAIAAPQPYQTIRDNWGQLLGKAPNLRTRILIRELIEGALSDTQFDRFHIRISEVGRFVHLHAYIVVPARLSSAVTITDQDDIRRRIHRSVAARFQRVSVDIAFTADDRWALSSVPADLAEAIVTLDDLDDLGDSADTSAPANPTTSKP